jgi:3-hydroxybutyryl-CoA dehydratase
MTGKTIHELTVGDAAQFSKTIAESDIYLFAGVTGDLNPAHVNEEYVKNTF